MTRIILVRHGETTWNIEGRFQGQMDTPLSEKGLKQGHMLAEGLRNIPFDLCIASPLQRSYNTGKFCADLHNIPVVTDERLMEINHGSWEGMLSKDIAVTYADDFATWHTQPHLVTMPDGGESLEDVRRRVRAAFDEYVEKYPDKTILVAAHDAVNKAIICDLMGMGMEHFWQVKQDNTCINVLEYNDGAWRCVLLNSTHHLGFLFSGIEQTGL